MSCIANVDWIQQNIKKTLHGLEPGISDHQRRPGDKNTTLWIQIHKQNCKMRWLQR